MSGLHVIIVCMVETREQQDARFAVKVAVLRVVEKLEPTLAQDLIAVLEAADDRARAGDN